jgi:mannose-6-phosphate isomerase
MTKNNLYPLTFRPIYKDKIWGGTRLAEVLGRNLPAGKLIGESWEISDHGTDLSVVANGPQQGKTLRDLIGQWGEKLLGTDVVKQFPGQVFPLLVKYIDAHDRLSIQVHPDDTYAAQYENGQLGKTEAWYVVNAVPNAKLIIGLKPGVTRDQLQLAFDRNELEKLVAEVPVQAGDALFLPAGRLHAILNGVVLCEIQESSDLTYRVYDWGRNSVSRPLHLQQSLATINFSPVVAPKLRGIVVPEGHNTITYLVACKHFALEKLTINAAYAGRCDSRHFVCLNILDGRATLMANGGTLAIDQGDSIVLPASLGDYTLKPVSTCIALRSYVPDLIVDVVRPLEKRGFSAQEIAAVVQ